MPSDGEIRALLRDFGAATLGESGARIMAPRVAPAWPGARIAAPAFPVRCSTGDNLAIFDHRDAGSARFDESTGAFRSAQPASAILVRKGSIFVRSPFAVFAR